MTIAIAKCHQDFFFSHLGKANFVTIGQKLADQQIFKISVYILPNLSFSVKYFYGTRKIGGPLETEMRFCKKEILKKLVKSQRSSRG